MERSIHLAVVRLGCLDMTVETEWKKPINHLEEAARQQRIEMLYEKSGRSDRSHPMHSLYTGLFQEAPSAQVPGPSAPEPTTASPDHPVTGGPVTVGAEQQLG
jgi:hypothetical protein